MKKLEYISLLLFFGFSCSHESNNTEDSLKQKSTIKSKSIPYSSSRTHTVEPSYNDENINLQYNHKVYSYDVSGTDDEGNYVDGSIEISGKYGSGTVEDDNGNEKSIDVEWTGNGTLGGTDEDGNFYELEVNK